ncbi:alkaline ceramidase 3-like isoform X1 [Babylonia areolata]|uniref:alkaline ceramidase 3-like isoform X1 n=1 Tax=Babylonia areolata TaxID=304850 RepID=UPI003FD3CA82
MAPTDGGYWGRVTSTIDWCEENYVVSRYVAEFWNTISNLIMILAPLFACCLAVRQKLEKPVIFSYVSIVVVGCGSWLFHMTLQYSMQLMDELPMIWGSAFLLYGILTLEGEKEKNYYWLMGGLLVYCTAVTVMYLVNNNPVFHEVAYGFMVVVMAFGAIRVIVKYQNKVGTMLYVSSFLTYMSGFILWNIDNIYCQHLRSLRRDKLHSAATPLFECHAWWHILAGVGTYLCLLFVSYMRYTILNMSPEVKFLLSVFPYVSVPSAAQRLKLS